MASDTQREIQSMQEAMLRWSDQMTKAEKASKGIADNFQLLAKQVDSQHATMTEYLKAVVELPRPFKEISNALITPMSRMKTFLGLHLDQLRLAEAAGDKNIEQYHLAVKLEQKRIELKDRLSAVTGKHLASEYLVIRSLYESVKRNGEINEALTQANSAYKIRQDFADNFSEVQARTGASMQEMLGATKALVGVWPKGRADFKETLQTIVQMEQGLGVSYEHSVQLARVFTLSLKTPVHEIADQISVIANSTSLAADEATRFAVEVGKALRLLGPGAASQIKEVTKYVTMLAGRMNDVGGDAGEIAKLFSEMTKGTAQGFMLRGLSGVTNPNQLGTEAGSQAAFQGIDRMIKKFVTAGPGSPMYLAQIENASQVLGISTESVVLWSKMIQKSTEPLDEHAKLQKRWQEQMEQSNRSLGRIREQFMALVQRALTPLLPYINKFFGAIADAVSFLASHQTTAYAALGIFSIAVTKTIWSLGRLAVTLWQVTAASNALTRAKLLGSETSIGSSIMGKVPFLAPVLKELKNGREINQYYSSLGVTKLGDMIRGLSPLSKLSTIFAYIRPFLAAGSLLQIGAAGAGGYMLGRVVDRTMDRLGDKWSAIFFPPLYALKKASETLGKYVGGGFNTVAAKQGIAGQLSSWQVIAQVRRELAAGHEREAEQLFIASAHRVKGLVTEKGAQAYLNAYTKLRTEMREREGLSTTIVPIGGQKDFNQKQLELQQESVKRLGNQEQILRDSKTQTKILEDMRNARTHEERLKFAADFRMLFSGNPPSIGKQTLDSIY